MIAVSIRNLAARNDGWRAGEARGRASTHRTRNPRRAHPRATEQTRHPLHEPATRGSPQNSEMSTDPVIAFHPPSVATPRDGLSLTPTTINW
jgi:hypothetical protein